MRSWMTFTRAIRRERKFMQVSEVKFTFLQAITNALQQEMERNDRIIVMGEDVRIWGGVFGRFKDFREKFGDSRILDTPISEAGFVGVAVGAAATGLRPVVDLMFVDFFGVAADQIF